MPQKQMQPDLCPLCGGTIEAQSGEVWLSVTTIKLLDQVLANAKPLKVIETPVFDLAGQRL